MKLLLIKTSKLNGGKGLDFHVEAKQKNYKEENKLRKLYEAPMKNI